jgi:hypothetical protein
VLVQDSSKPTDLVRLQVHANDADDAREILDARVKIDDEPRQPVEDEEHCRRCWSTEIFRAEPRGKVFAQVALTMIGMFFLFRAIRGAVRLFGHDLSPNVEHVFVALVLFLPFIIAFIDAVAPKKRCRNCGLEWRGTPRTS